MLDLDTLIGLCQHIKAVKNVGKVPCLMVEKSVDGCIKNVYELHEIIPYGGQRTGKPEILFFELEKTQADDFVDRDVGHIDQFSLAIKTVLNTTKRKAKQIMTGLNRLGYWLVSSGEFKAMEKMLHEYHVMRTENEDLREILKSYQKGEKS